MSSENPEKPGPAGKIKLGLLLGAGAVLLWFLIMNLRSGKDGEHLWNLSLWPIAYIPAPGTLYIVIFMLMGFAAGFGICFYWLRGHRLGKAVNILTETDKKSQGECEEREE